MKIKWYQCPTSSEFKWCLINKTLFFLPRNKVKLKIKSFPQKYDFEVNYEGKQWRVYQIEPRYRLEDKEAVKWIRKNVGEFLKVEKFNEKVKNILEE